MEEEKQYTPTTSSSSTLPQKEQKREKQYREEQKYMYNMLHDFAPEGGINQLFIKWGVDSTGKKRKQQFCERLFAHPSNFQESIDSAEIISKMTGVYSKCVENGKRMTRKEFDEFVAAGHQKMVASSKRGGCCLL